MEWLPMARSHLQRLRGGAIVAAIERPGDLRPPHSSLHLDGKVYRSPFTCSITARSMQLHHRLMLPLKCHQDVSNVSRSKT